MSSSPCGLYPATDPRPTTAWCGPSAIAAITGKTPELVENAVLVHRLEHPTGRRERLKGRVVAMWWREVEPVCNALGWSIIDQTEGNRGLSFARWQRTIGRDGPFLVLLTGHFVAVGAGQFVDSNRRTPISLRSAPYRRKRIMRVARLIPNLTEAT